MPKRKWSDEPYTLSVSRADNNKVCISLGDPNDPYEGFAIYLGPKQFKKFITELQDGAEKVWKGVANGG